MNAALVGRSLEELDTPVLLVNLDAFERNLQALVSCCRQWGTAWRPHSKAHKSPDIARLQLQAGACGITCAKLGEAELMARSGVPSILVANQIVTPAKLERLAALQELSEVIVAVDDLQVVETMATAARKAGRVVPVLVEVDIGMHRVGADPGGEALEIARAVHRAQGLELKGVMGYEGHVLDVWPRADKERACHQALERLLHCRDLLVGDGLPAPVVSAGGTGCYDLTAAYEGITEIQAGGGIFMDAMYRDRFHVEGLECALTVLATVTSRHGDRAVLDAGFKTLSAHHHRPQVLHRDDLELQYLSAEHGVLRVLPGRAGPALGERLELLVGYSDSTNFLHDRFVGVRGGRVECVWPIAGRGLLT